MDIAAAQHVCRTVKKVCFRYLEIQNLNQDPLENIFGFVQRCLLGCTAVLNDCGPSSGDHNFTRPDNPVDSSEHHTGRRGNLKSHNIFDVIHFHCCSNNNQTVGQFVGALKTSINKGLDFSGLMGTNCEDDGTPLLDDLKVSDASPPQVSRENPDDVSDSFHVQRQHSRKWLLLYVQVTWQYCQ
jgi:hypothetical protein